MVVLLKPKLTRPGAEERSNALGNFSFIVSETARDARLAYGS
jgi:hypothetical protein